MVFCHLQKLSKDFPAWWFISSAGWRRDKNRKQEYWKETSDRWIFDQQKPNWTAEPGMISALDQSLVLMYSRMISQYPDHQCWTCSTDQPDWTKNTLVPSRLHPPPDFQTWHSENVFSIPISDTNISSYLFSHHWKSKALCPGTASTSEVTFTDQASVVSFPTNWWLA